MSVLGSLSMASASLTFLPPPPPDLPRGQKIYFEYLMSQFWEEKYSWTQASTRENKKKPRLSTQ